jgi:hypothetical protein
MAVAAPQSAMPNPVATTRPAPRARLVAASRHPVLSYVPEPRTATVVARLAALMLATACAIGVAVGVALTVLSALVTQLGH